MTEQVPPTMETNVERDGAEIKVEFQTPVPDWLFSVWLSQEQVSTLVKQLLEALTKK